MEKMRVKRGNKEKATKERRGDGKQRLRRRGERSRGERDASRGDGSGSGSGREPRRLVLAGDLEGLRNSNHCVAPKGETGWAGPEPSSRKKPNKTT